MKIKKKTDMYYVNMTVTEDFFLKILSFASLTPADEVIRVSL